MKPFAAFLSCCLTILSLSAAEPPPAESDAGPLAEPILAPNQATVEVQVFAATRVPAIPPAVNAADWTKLAATLRRRVLDEVALRGEARAWAEAPARVEWLDTIATPHGYQVRKLRYEAVPGLWLPALLYQPDRLSGRVPVVLNVNGHEKTGMATPYIQERCINLAKRGLLALNPEWLGRGQLLEEKGLDHYRMNQLDLCGTSGLGVFQLAVRRALDVALGLPNADPERVAVTGLSGGGWQTIFLGALDERVKLANPVAGYSSYVTRVQFPSLDLGDSEQTPSDLATVVDYTHLTALMAPRPTLLTYNAKDNCCFRADYALAPLVQAASPVFRLLGAADRLRQHVNHDAGHNYGRDNREALYRFLRDHRFTATADFPLAEIPSEAEVRTADELRVPLLPGNQDFNSLARRIAAGLPLPGKPDRARLRAVVHAPEYVVVPTEAGSGSAWNAEVRRWRLRMGLDWTLPAVELTPPGARSTVVFVADAGRAAAAPRVRELLAAGHRVVAVDPFYFGESKIAGQPGLFAILVAALGERPLGIQAGQVAAVARWLADGRGLGPVGLVTEGPRTGLIGLVAAALEVDAISGLEQRGAMASLREVIEGDVTVMQRPEQFCFGLLREFDVPQIGALVSPRPLVAR
jgi:dienelactone hydrolase